MNNIYEFFENAFGIYDNQFSMVFGTLFDKGGYNSMGMILILIPLGFLSLFYLLWKYPYATHWHFLIFVGIISLTVAVLTYSSVSLTLAKLLIHSNPEIADFTKALVLKYAILNAFLSLVVSFICSLFLRGFSKVQKHLPF